MPDHSLDNETLKHIACDGTIEFCNYNPRSRSGMRTWELKIKNADGTRKIMMVRDSGISLDIFEIKVNPFATREARNREICRLYNEEGLSQLFLANLFNMSQPSVSVIVNKK